MDRKLHIVLGVTGSIAAYKACELVRLMSKAGMDVSVLMTKAATEFVTELTFRTLSQNPVGVDMWAPCTQWRPEHISLAERGDLFVVAPCTANVMAKMAGGLADDLLTASLLATTAPVLIAPAMNVHMWEHPATQQNLETLKSRGVRVVDVTEGDLACGYDGRGRMAEPETVLAAVRACLGS